MFATLCPLYPLGHYVGLFLLCGALISSLLLKWSHSFTMKFNILFSPRLKEMDIICSDGEHEMTLCYQLLETALYLKQPL